MEDLDGMQMMAEMCGIQINGPKIVKGEIVELQIEYISEDIKYF